MRIRKLLSWVVVVSAGLIVLIGVVSSSNTYADNSISHAYRVTSSIANGSIVSLNPNKSSYVEPANFSSGNKLLGVVLPDKQSLIAINSTSSTVQVATSGVVTTLVSDVNGNVKIGDQIAASPFNGVGMVASLGQEVIGLAQSSLNSKSSNVYHETVKKKDGQSQSILVGYVSVSIAPGLDQAANNLSGLQKIIFNLTGRKISLFNIVISVVIAFVALATFITLIYSSIYSGIVAIGRNPLANRQVLKATLRVMGMAVLIVILAGFVIYLLLR